MKSNEKMQNKIKNASLPNTKYLNTFKMWIDS